MSEKGGTISNNSLIYDERLKARVKKSKDYLVKSPKGKIFCEFCGNNVIVVQVRKFLNTIAY